MSHPPPPTNIIPNPGTYARFLNCSVAIQILVCLMLLVLVIKEALNFYFQNYMDALKQKTKAKNQQNTNIMLDNDKKQQALSPKQQLQLKSSKHPIKSQKQFPISQSQNPIAPPVNPHHINLQLQAPIPHPHPHTHQKSSSSLKQPSPAQDNKLSYRINIRIEKLVIKLPIFSIMIANIVLLTSYEFLVIMAYCAIILMVISQFISNRLSTVSIVLEIAAYGAIIAGFINAYVTPNIGAINVNK